MTECDRFWGSHGCSLPPGHTGPHLCIVTEDDGHRQMCSEYHDDTEEVWYADDVDWGEAYPLKGFSLRGPIEGQTTLSDPTPDS